MRLTDGRVDRERVRERKREKERERERERDCNNIRYLIIKNEQLQK